MKRMKVTNDFIFQKIFGQNENKGLLICLLNAIMELEGERKLDDIEIIENTKLRKECIDDKLGILDIRAKTVHGEQINIEVQLINEYNMDKRTLFYWSRLFTEQLKEGRPFNELKKTIAINILNFTYVDIDEFNTVFHLWEDRQKECKLTDVMEIRFIELPKFRKKKTDLSRLLDCWLVFIEDSPEEVLQMAMKAEPMIEKAEEILERLGSFDDVKRYYEAREMAIHDEITRMEGAKEEGMIEGKKEGIIEGKMEGMIEGEKKGKIETAKKMLEKNMSVDLIIEITGLERDVVENLIIRFGDGS